MLHEFLSDLISEHQCTIVIDNAKLPADRSLRELSNRSTRTISLSDDDRWSSHSSNHRSPRTVVIDGDRWNCNTDSTETSSVSCVAIQKLRSLCEFDGLSDDSSSDLDENSFHSESEQVTDYEPTRGSSAQFHRAKENVSQDGEMSQKLVSTINRLSVISALEQERRYKSFEKKACKLKAKQLLQSFDSYLSKNEVLQKSHSLINHASLKDKNLLYTDLKQKEDTAHQLISTINRLSILAAMEQERRYIDVDSMRSSQAARTLEVLESLEKVLSEVDTDDEGLFQAGPNLL